MSANTSKTILLVEDEILIAMSEKMALEKYRYNVIIVNSGEKAIESVNQSDGIDLILMDIDLGKGIDGTQAAEIILKDRDIPVVFLSSHAEPEIVEKTEKITSYGYVVKSSSSAVLDASIKMAFKLFEANRRIIESEINQKTMIANISDVIVILDRDAINRYKSPNITNWFGWQPEELIGQSAWDEVHPDDLRDMQSLFFSLLEKPGAAGTAECRYLCKNGKYAIIEITLVNLFHNKVIQGVLGNYHDISTRKKNEQEQLALAALVENSNDIAIVKDLDRRIVSGNRNFIRASMRESLTHLIGKTDAEILGITEDEEPAHSYMLDDLKALQLKPGESLLREEDIPSADGLMRTYMTRKFPIRIASRVIGMGVITTDITERKHAEEEIKAQNSLLSMIMETSPVGIATVDVEGNITYANYRAEQILGIEKNKITARKYNASAWNPTDINGDPLPDEKQPFYIVKTTRKTAYNIQHGITWPDGRYIILSVNASPMSDKDGQFSGMVATFEDITDKLRNEKIIISQLSEKEILLKEVHHRIKNNIGSIEALLSMQLQSINNPEAVSVLQDAIGRISSMRILYDKLLISEEYKNISVKNYIETLIAAIVCLFPDNNKISRDIRIDDFNLSSKKMFPLGIILNELLTNIMKYAFKGRERGLITISLSVINNQAILQMQDNGNGLPEGFDLSKTHGFGLILVEMLSKQLGGTFVIENYKGTRSILKFDI